MSEPEKPIKNTKDNAVIKIPPLKECNISAHELALCSERSARALIPFQTAWQLCALPLSVILLNNRKEILTLAISPDHTYEELKQIRFLAERELHIIEAPPALLREALTISYKGDPEYVLSATKTFQTTTPVKEESIPESVDGIPHTLRTIIEYAHAKSASDIHLKPRQEHALIVLRIDGKTSLSDLPQLDITCHQQLVNRVKVLSKCDVTVRDRAQDGSFSFKLSDREIVIRLSIIPTVFGEQVVLRIPKREELKKMDDLSLPQFTKEVLSEAVHRKEGTIIFCGPTGSGKTTTMYSLLHSASTENRHIITLEDPIEQILPFATQVEIDEQKKRGYTSSLRGVLRQDPDLLLIGEIRDRESAQIAFQASLTGHFIVTTLHARSVMEVFLRMKHFEISPLDISQCLNVIVAQRLIPKLCTACKVIDLPSSRSIGSTVYQEAGCHLCEYGGYYGLIPVTETLRFHASMRSTLFQGGDVHECFKPGNYQSFLNSAHHQMLQGHISIKQVQAFEEEY